VISAAAAANEPLFQWIQFGVTGLVILGFLTGYIWPRPAVTKLLEDNESLRHQRDELIKIHQGDTLPTLARTNELLARLNERRE
jgi:hypothetical protein